MNSMLQTRNLNVNACLKTTLNDYLADTLLSSVLFSIDVGM